MCHQRGSVIAEVVLKRVTRPDGDSDPRTPDLLAQELVEKLNDRMSILCRKDLGSLAVKSAVIDGPFAEPLCNLVALVLRAGDNDWHRTHKELYRAVESEKKHRTDSSQTHHSTAAQPACIHL